MTSLTELRELADEAIENEAECPDCDDNRWDLDDAATPEVIKALIAVAEAAEVVLANNAPSGCDGTCAGWASPGPCGACAQDTDYLRRDLDALKAVLE